MSLTEEQLWSTKKSRTATKAVRDFLIQRFHCSAIRVATVLYWPLSANQ